MAELRDPEVVHHAAVPIHCLRPYPGLRALDVGRLDLGTYFRANRR